MRGSTPTPTIRCEPSRWCTAAASSKSRIEVQLRSKRIWGSASTPGSRVQSKRLDLCVCMSIIFYPAALADSSLINFPSYDRILSPTTMGYTGATLSPPSRDWICHGWVGHEACEVERQHLQHSFGPRIHRGHVRCSRQTSARFCPAVAP